MTRRILLFVIGFSLLSGVSAYFAPYFISTQDVKDNLIVAISNATGRRFSIDGPLSITVFPTVGIHAEKVTVDNPQGFEDATPFITLKKLRVNAGLIALLSSNIEINSFVLEEPVVNLHINKNGTKNWVFQNTKTDGSEKPELAPRKDIPEDAFALPDNMSLNDIGIVNGTVLYTNDLTRAKHELKKLDATLSLKKMSSPFSVTGSAEWNGKPITTTILINSIQSLLNYQKTKLDIKIDNELIHIETQGHQDTGAYVGKLTVKSSSLKSLAAWVSPESKPLSIAAPLALNSSANVRCGINYCNLTDMVTSLDSFASNGDIKVNFADKKPRIELQIQSNELDLTPFLSNQKQSSLLQYLVADAVAAPERWSREPIDLSALKLFNATASLDAGILKLNSFRAEKVALKAQVAQGKLSVDMVDTTLYEGKGNLSLKADSNLVPVTYAASGQFKGVQLSPLLADTADIKRISGVGELDFDLRGEGDTQAGLVASLAGSGRIAASKGQFTGVNLLDMLRNVGSAFGNTTSNEQNTSFTDMNATFTINQGIVINPDLAMTLSGFNVKGQGSLDLPAYAVKYRLAPQAVRTSTTAEGTTVEKEGLTVPVIIEGSLDNPSYRPDAGAMLQDALSDPKKFKEQLKNSSGAIKDQLKDPKAAVKNIKNILKGL